MHIPTRNIQCGYKEGISAIDSIIQIDHYIEHANRDARMLLMYFPNACDAIKRALLCTTHYKKGRPVEMTTHPPMTSRYNTSAEIQRNIWGTYRTQHWSIPRVSHKCDTLHNLHGRRDGGLRIPDPPIETAYKNSASLAGGTSVRIGMRENKGAAKQRANLTEQQITRAIE